MNSRRIRKILEFLKDSKKEWIYHRFLQIKEIFKNFYIFLKENFLK
jgi:hypothetical protein